MNARNNFLYRIIITIIIILTFYFSYKIFNSQYIGVMVEYDEESRFVINEVEKGAMGDRLGLQIGDIVLEVNKHSPSQHQPIKNLSQLENVDELKIKKQNGNIELLTIDKEFDVQITFHLITPLIFLVLSFYCSYFIYKSEAFTHYKSPSILILFLLTVSFAYLSAGAGSRGDLLSRYFNLLLFISTPVVYLHYVYEYFKENGRIWFSKWFIKIGYTLAAFNLVLDIFAKVVYDYNEHRLLIKLINLLTFSLLFIMCYTLIIIGLKKSIYKIQKYLIRAILLSNVFALTPFVIFYVFPYIFFKIEIFSPAYLASFLLIIPFTLVYLFLSKKVYDIEFLLGRFRYYTLLSIIPALIAVVINVNLLKGNQLLFPVKFYVLFFIVLFLTFIIKEFLDHKFQLQRFSEKYNYKDSLFIFIKKITKVNSLNEVIDTLSAVITDVLLVSDIHLILIDNENKPKGKYSEEINDCANGITGKIVEVDKGFVLNIGETDKGKYLLLCLSKMNTPKLTIDEKNWLNALAYYTSITISNFMKIESLMSHLEQLKQEGKSPVWYNRVIYSLEEKQRSMLARDLHDSVLQDLISIKQTCENLIRDNPNTEIENIYNNLNGVIQTTRETCNELRPQVLYDLGLERALEKLVKDNSNGLDIRLNISRLSAPNKTEVQLSLYRIIQELLSNARKHSNASKVLIMMITIKDKTIINYEDDGVGANKNDLFNKEGSMGLSGIRERVRTLNGTMEVKTSEGEGFKVVIEI